MYQKMADNSVKKMVESGWAYFDTGLFVMSSAAKQNRIIIDTSPAIFCEWLLSAGLGRVVSLMLKFFPALANSFVRLAT